jgi:hypothetical protein
MDWFVARNGKSVGPLMLVTLVEGVRRGLIEPDDYILQLGADRWKRAKDVSVLWAVPLEPLVSAPDRRSWTDRPARRR